MLNKLLEWLNVDSVLEGGKKYLDNRLEFIKLEMQELLTNIIVAFVGILLVVFSALMALAFLSIAVGNILNTLLNSTYWGFLIMGFVFVAFTTLILLYRNKLRSKIAVWCTLMIQNKINNKSEDE
jgi:hypothetical protein